MWRIIALGLGLFGIIAAVAVVMATAGEAKDLSLGILLAVMCFWWMFEVVPLAITALLPMALFPALGLISLSDAASAYGHDVVFLFLGGFVLSAALQKWNLHTRIAIVVLSKVPARPDYVVGAFMAITAFLSMWVSNTATAMMMLPMALSVISLLENQANGKSKGPKLPEKPDEGEPSSGPMAQALLFGIAISASIGGMATLIGSPPNAVLAAFLREQRQIELNFAQWLGLGLPVALILLPIVWWLLCRVLFSLRVEEPGLKSALKKIEGLAEGLGPMKREEWMVAGIFALAACGWIIGGFIKLPGLRWNDSMVALVAAALLFIVPVSWRSPRFLMDNTWTKKVNWEVLLLFGGGLCLASALSASPYLHQLAELLLRLFGGKPVLFLLASLLVVVFFSEIASNTATVAAFLPIILALTSRMELPVIPTCAAVTLAGSLGFMLPVGTPPNAIVYSSGHLRIGTMIRVGLIFDLVGILVILGAALSWFPWFW